MVIPRDHLRVSHVCCRGGEGGIGAGLGSSFCRRRPPRARAPPETETCREDEEGETAETADDTADEGCARPRSS